MTVFGFSFVEAGNLTIGQLNGYFAKVPYMLPYINAFAERPKEKLTGDAALAVLGVMGVEKK